MGGIFCNWKTLNSNMKRIVIFLFFILVYRLIALEVVYGQDIYQNFEGLTKDKLFFEQQLKEFDKYLTLIGVDQAFSTQDLIVEDEKITLKLGIGSISIWRSILKSYNDNDFDAFGRDLFQKFSHLTEVDKKKIEIHVNSTSNDPDKALNVVIKYWNGKLKVFGPSEESLRAAMIEQTFIIKSSSSIVEGNSELSSKKVISLIRQEILKYYEEKGISWDIKCCNIDEEEERITFFIRNVKNEIIDDCFFCPYELIRLTISVSRSNDNEITIMHNLQAKYGSGVFKAPRKSGYKDMELNKYKEYLPEYLLKIKNTIKKTLK